MRPGEIMLAEMARALNIGLGLNGDGSSTSQERTSEPRSAADNDELARRSADIAPTGRPLPPEDSFERFLLNLQADLRVALSEGGSPDSATATGTLDSEDGRRDSPDLDSTEAESVHIPVFDRHASNQQHSDDEELPALEDVSDSEDEDEAERREGLIAEAEGGIAGGGWRRRGRMKGGSRQLYLVNLLVNLRGRIRDE